MNDLKFALRQLLKNPGFTAVAVLTLALGIGANTAIFSVVNAVLLKPLPYKDPDQLVMVFTTYLQNDSHKNWVAAPTLEAWRKQSTVFAGLAARGYANLVLTGQGEPASLNVCRLSANAFRLLGVRPSQGRDFMADEEKYGNDHVVLLSDALWKARFQGDSGIVGRSITLNDQPFAVVGVMPPHTFFPEPNTQLWTPLAFSPSDLADHGSHNYLIFGRLKPGVTLQQANTEMEVISRRLAGSDQHYKGSGAEVIRLQEIMVGDWRAVLSILLASVGLVLLVGCVNIANLQLASLAARSREFAIRTALGARRRQLIGQLVVEGMSLAAIGAVVGIILARVGVQAFVRLAPIDVPRIGEGVGLDGEVLGFAVLLTVVTGLIFGLVPALRTFRPALVHELNETSRGNTRSGHRLRGALVVSEVALSLALLIAAGLTLRSFGRLLSQPLGYNPEHVVSMDLSLPAKKYPTLADQTRFFEGLRSRVEKLPGIQSAALVRGLPLSGQNVGMSIGIPGAPPPAPGEPWDADYAQVSPGYFQTMKIALLQGRDFDDRDRTNTTPVTIVNETFARAFKLGTNVIGRRISFGGVQNIEIIGVIKDVKRSNLSGTQRAEVYRTFQQQCWGFMSLVVRTARDPSDVTWSVRAELDTLDKDQPLEHVRSMSQLVDSSVGQRRLSVQLLAGFAVVALILAIIGLHGVISHGITQRTREIGIRMSLGAQRKDVLSLIIRQGMQLVTVGILIGLASSLALSRSLRSLLFEIGPLDPITFAFVPLILASVAFIACWLPARRAAKVDPIEALRME